MFESTPITVGNVFDLIELENSDKKFGVGNLLEKKDVNKYELLYLIHILNQIRSNQEAKSAIFNLIEENIFAHSCVFNEFATFLSVNPSYVVNIDQLCSKFNSSTSLFKRQVLNSLSKLILKRKNNISFECFESILKFSKHLQGEKLDDSNLKNFPLVNAHQNLCYSWFLFALTDTLIFNNFSFYILSVIDSEKTIEYCLVHFFSYDDEKLIEILLELQQNSNEPFIIDKNELFKEFVSFYEYDHYQIIDLLTGQDTNYLLYFLRYAKWASNLTTKDFKNFDQIKLFLQRLCDSVKLLQKNQNMPYNPKCLLRALEALHSLL